MNKLEWDDLLEKYCSGELPSDEMNRINHTIETDPEVRRLYQDHLLVQDILTEFDKEDVKNRFIQESSRPKSSFNKKWWWLTIFVALIIIGSVFYLRISQLEPSMVAMEYSIEDTNAGVRGSELDLEYLDEYYKPFRKGQELMKEGKYREARDSFKSIKEETPLISENKEWMIALTHYAESGEDHPVFKTTLERIISNPSHNAYKKARSLEIKINSFWHYFKR